MPIYDQDDLLIIEALRQLAERSDHDIMVEHLWGLADDFADGQGIEIEEAADLIAYDG